jgi:hypothetical protein
VRIKLQVCRNVQEFDNIKPALSPFVFADERLNLASWSVNGLS